MNKILNAQQFLEQTNEAESLNKIPEQVVSKEHLELMILNEIVNQYKKITATIGDLAIEQEKFKEASRKEITDKFKSLEKNIKYAKDINFYIAIFSFATTLAFVILLFTKLS